MPAGMAACDLFLPRPLETNATSALYRPAFLQKHSCDAATLGLFSGLKYLDREPRAGPS